MSDEHLKLPYQLIYKETEESLEAFRKIAQTTVYRGKTLSELYHSGIFPDDLKDYARYLIHDSSRDVGNLRNYIGRGLTDTFTWRSMYRCLQWIQHLDVLLELVDLRTNR